MKIDIDDLKINYYVSGQGKTVVLLHGWGGSIKSFEAVQNYLQGGFKTYSLDLPGFGESDEPPSPWKVSDYAGLVAKFITKMQIKNPIMIGHSFGGRIIIYLAGTKQIEINKIILVDSAGIKPKRTMKYYYKVYTYKSFKYIANLSLVKLCIGQNRIEKLRNKFGSADYKNASDSMRKTMVLVVNEDLKEWLPKINKPTLLIWGENDTATPVSDGKLMEKLIPDSGLVVLRNAGHFSYLDKLNEFLIIIGDFLKKDMGVRDE